MYNGYKSKFYNKEPTCESYVLSTTPQLHPSAIKNIIMTVSL